VNKSLIAGAILMLGAAVAVPAVAWSAGEPQSPAPGEAVPPPPAAGEHPGARGPAWMHGHMRMHRTADISPQQRCERRLAHRAARAAYIASLLKLTPEQRPLYEKLRGAMQEAADKQHQFCASLKPRDQETLLDRIDRREQFLTARLQAMQSTKPALQALYQALTPEQKAIIDHPRRGR
jgi:hypothetical protein